MNEYMNCFVWMMKKAAIVILMGGVLHEEYKTELDRLAAFLPDCPAKEAYNGGFLNNLVVGGFKGLSAELYNNFFKEFMDSPFSDYIAGWIIESYVWRANGRK